MLPDQQNSTDNPGNERMPAAGTGNASNPPPREAEQGSHNQLLDKKAEKYLREVASIEDVPDVQDQHDMDETIKKENGDK